MYSYATRVNFIKIEFKYKNDVTSTFYQNFVVKGYAVW